MTMKDLGAGVKIRRLDSASGRCAAAPPRLRTDAPVQ